MLVSSPADETRDALERRIKGCPPPFSTVGLVDTNIDVNEEYVREAVTLASKVALQSPLGTEERDMAEYMLTIVQELYRQRGRVQFLEGWKLAVEAAFKTDE